MLSIIFIRHLGTRTCQLRDSDFDIFLDYYITHFLRGRKGVDYVGSGEGVGRNGRREVGRVGLVKGAE